MNATAAAPRRPRRRHVFLPALQACIRAAPPAKRKALRDAVEMFSPDPHGIGGPNHFAIEAGRAISRRGPPAAFALLLLIAEAAQDCVAIGATRRQPSHRRPYVGLDDRCISANRRVVPLNGLQRRF